MSAAPTDPQPAADAPLPPPTPPAPPPARDMTTAVTVGVLVVGALLVAFALVRKGDGQGDEAIGKLVARSDELARTPGASPAQVVGPLLEAYQLDPDDLEVNKKLGMTLFLQDRHKEALPYLQRAASSAQDDADLALAQGICLTALERYPDAKAPLERAARLAPPKDERPFYYLGLVARFTGDAEGAVRHLTTCTERSPRHPIALRLLAEALDEVGRHDDAIAPLRSLSLVVPLDVTIRRDIDDRLVSRDGWAAVTSAAAAAAGGPSATTVDCYMAGRLLAQDHRRAAEARACFERSLALDPSNPWASLALGIEDMRDGKLDAAVVAFEALLKARPEFTEAEAQLVQVHRRRGDVAAVISHSASLLRKGRSAGLAREAVIAARSEAGDHDEAEALARELIPPAAAPGDTSRFLLAQVLVWRGQFDAAGEVLAAMREAAPPGHRAPLWGLEALNELEAGRDDAARKAFDAALADVGEGFVAPPQLFLWSGIARALSDPEAARRLWEQGARTGRLHNPQAFHTWCCRRLIGQATIDDVVAAARIGGRFDLNDALFVEGLACELAGDLDAARKAYVAAREVTVGAEHPRRPIDRALERLARN